MHDDTQASTIRELFPYLRVRGAEAAIAFYTEVFGARERLRLVEPGGRVGHAELVVGDAVIMLSDPYPEMGLPAPEGAHPDFISLHLHVDDCDAMAARMVAAGGTLTRPPADQFYGERSCTVRDPFGHSWHLGHSIEEVSPAEMQRRYDAMFE